MKLTFINVNGVEYMVQFDSSNVLFTRKKADTGKMVAIEIEGDQVVGVYVMKKKEVRKLPIIDRFDTDPRSLVRAYAPIMENTEL